MLRVVLDANVYVSALISPSGPPGQIVEQFLRTAAFELLLSPAIVEETLQAFRYPKVRNYIHAGVEPALWLEGVILLSRLVTGERTVRPVSRDPDDDKYVAAAIEGGATVIVSGDPDRLAIKGHDGIRIVTPRTFLGVLA